MIPEFHPQLAMDAAFHENWVLFARMTLWFLAWMTPACLLAVALGLVLILPHQRLERARFLLDLLASGMAQGRRPEDILQDLSARHDPALGVHGHLLAAYVERGLPLPAALDRVPRALPPQVRAALKAGFESGEPLRLLPACRDMLRDGPAQTRHALHYLILLLTAFTPLTLAVVLVMQVFVVPKFQEIAFDLGEGLTTLPELHGIRWAGYLAIPLLLASGLAFLGLLSHAGGPQWSAWLKLGRPSLPDRWSTLIPWKRRRLLRDFLGTLGALLDAGLPEERAISLAADSTANEVFRLRAARARADLISGRGLLQALDHLDASGELRWRMANASHSHTSFTAALEGWRSALDARAFQLEQGTAHAVTTALILAHGVLVGLVVTSLFGLLTHVLNAAVLW